MPYISSTIVLLHSSMPELDSTSPYHRISILAWEYKEIVERCEDPSINVHELQTLNSERTVLHNQVIEEFARLGEHFPDRESAMKRAMIIAKWARPAEDYYDDI